MKLGGTREAAMLLKKVQYKVIGCNLYTSFL